VFALKEFKNGATFMEFERESKVLRKLLEKPHKNITPHYASWSQAGHFFMLSPLASCNLKVYWKNNRPELSNSEFVLWELRQLSGLADGLRYIYNLGGWHHDLKAENVLVFEEGDGGRPTLKIADFGSAKIRARRPAPQDESSPTDSYSQGTSAYEAPDYVILGETSRPYDVWTLACLFMDMLVWTFGSRPSELEMFSNERRVLRGGKLGTDTMFWCVEQHNGEYWTHWKPFVEKRLQNLKALCDSDQGSRRAVFKELVNTISKMLRMDPVQRVKAFEVHNDLERVTLWAEEAVKEPAWKIQHLLIGATPSTDRSETSGESNLDGIPVRAPRGYLMMPHPPSLTTDSRNLHPALWQSLRDASDLKFMGANENLVQNTNSSKFHMVVDPVVDPLDTDYQPGDKPDGGLLIGSHLMSADGDNFAEAQTVVASVAASESHLPSLPLPSIPMVKRDDGAACM
jgi:serine/threonine protein kinase